MKKKPKFKAKETIEASENKKEIKKKLSKTALLSAIKEKNGNLNQVAKLFGKTADGSFYKLLSQYNLIEIVEKARKDDKKSCSLKDNDLLEEITNKAKQKLLEIIENIKIHSYTERDLKAVLKCIDISNWNRKEYLESEEKEKDSLQDMNKQFRAKVKQLEREGKL